MRGENPTCSVAVSSGVRIFNLLQLDCKGLGPPGNFETRTLLTMISSAPSACCMIRSKVGASISPATIPSEFARRLLGAGRRAATIRLQRGVFGQAQTDRSFSPYAASGLSFSANLANAAIKVPCARRRLLWRIENDVGRLYSLARWNEDRNWFSGFTQGFDVPVE